MSPIEDRLNDLVGSERSLVAREHALGPAPETLRAARGRAQHIERRRRGRRAVVVVLSVLAVLTIGVAVFEVRRDASSSVTVGLPDPTQFENPPGIQTGPAVPDAAFPHPGRPAGSGDSPIGFEPGERVARTGYNDRQLVVSIIGGKPRSGPEDDDPCAVDYVGTARLDGDRFIIGLTSVGPKKRPKEELCSAVGYLRTAVINLPEPLGGRAVSDAAGSVRVVDATSFLVPRVVPSGLTLATDSITASSEDQTNFSWSRTYVSGDPAASVPTGTLDVQEVELGDQAASVSDGLRVLPMSSPDQALDGRIVDNQGAPMTPVGHATVRGHDALLFDFAGGNLHSLAIMWQEGTRVHSVTLGRADTSGLTMDDVVATAQSMSTVAGG